MFPPASSPLQIRPALIPIRGWLIPGLVFWVLALAGCSPPPEQAPEKPKIVETAEPSLDWNAWHRANPSLPAVARALDWLAARQGANGCWGGETNRVKLTSLACLAFLARGETPASDRYGEVMDRGLRAILAEAERTIPRSDTEQALLIACLADACAVMRVPMLDAALRKRSQSLLSGK